jgi:hypothetical protein
MRSFVMLVLLLCAAAVAEATVLVSADLEELSRDARAIARGHVVGVDAQWTEGRRTIETIVTLQTDEYLKGRLGEQLKFRVPGGTLGRFRNVVVGAPEFELGQHVIVFLGARGPTIPYVLGLNQGVFRVAEAAGGGLVVSPSRTDASLLIGGAPRATIPPPASLAAFSRRVRSLAGTPQ